MMRRTMSELSLTRGSKIVLDFGVKWFFLVAASMVLSPLLSVQVQAVQFVSQDFVGSTGTSWNTTSSLIHHSITTTQPNNLDIVVAGDNNYLAMGDQSAANSRQWTYGIIGPPSSSSGSSFGNIQSIVVQDINGDGRLDSVMSTTMLGGAGADSSVDKPAIVIAYNTNNPNSRASSIDVLLSESNAPSILKESGPVTQLMGYDVKVVDWNVDGRLDIIASVTGSVPGSSGLVAKGWILAFLQQSDGSFDAQILASNDVIGGIARFEVADMDKNGLPDVIALCITTQKLIALWQQQQENKDAFGRVVNTVTTTTTTVLANSVRTETNVHFALTVGKLNQDALLDIILVGTAQVDAYVQNSIQGSPFNFSQFKILTILPAHVSYDFRTWQVDLVDIDKDGLSDLVMIYGLQNSIQWSRQSANNIMNFLVPLAIVSRPDSFAVADFNGDGYLDLAAHSADTGRVSAIYNDPSLPTPDYTMPTHMGVGSMPNMMQPATAPAPAPQPTAPSPVQQPQQQVQQCLPLSASCATSTFSCCNLDSVYCDYGICRLKPNRNLLGEDDAKLYKDDAEGSSRGGSGRVRGAGRD